MPEQVAKVGLEADTVTADPDSNFRNPTRPTGAESGAVDAGQPPSPLLAEVLALVQRLDPADRARLAELLREGERV